MNIMRYITGVDFVFPVKSLHEDILKESVREGYRNYQEEKNKKTNVMDNNKQDGGINIFDLGNEEEENLTKSETKEDDEYDLQKELEAKFDELFGPIDD